MNGKCSEIYDILSGIIENPVCELEFNNNFELLVAVVLSAQCTDKRVNMVTKELFKKYDTPQKLASASMEDIEAIIKPCGFFKTKAKHLKELSVDIVERFNGQVPDNMDDLKSLSGVGQKTANVVLAEAYGCPTMAVDTHVFRVSNRLGIAHSNNVEEVEEQLKNNFDKDKWIKLHHMLILFGRYYCKSRSPKCENCKLKKYCLKWKEE